MQSIHLLCFPSCITLTHEHQMSEETPLLVICSQIIYTVIHFSFPSADGKLSQWCYLKPTFGCRLASLFWQTHHVSKQGWYGEREREAMCSLLKQCHIISKTSFSDKITDKVIVLFCDVVAKGALHNYLIAMVFHWLKAKRSGSLASECFLFGAGYVVSTGFIRAFFC